MTSSKLNRESILSEADYHSYSNYSLLSFYNDLEMSVDSLTNDYIPISATSQRGKNPKMFVVGVIPPSQEVTRRLLDRSASLAEEVYQDWTSKIPEPSFTGSASNGGIGGPESKWRNCVSELDLDFWVDYVNMCKRLKQDPKAVASVIFLESGFNAAAQNVVKDKQTPEGRVVARGLIQFTKDGIKNGVMTREEWETIDTKSARDQLPYLERYFKGQRSNKTAGQIYRVVFGGYNNPDGSLYASKAQQDAYIAAHPGAVFTEPEKQQKAIDQNKGYVTKDPTTGFPTVVQSSLDRAVEGSPPQAALQKIEEALAFIDSGQTVAPVKGDAGTTDRWLDSGSAAAADASEFTDLPANLNETVSGKALQARQQAMIDASIAALNNIKNTPPLRMLVNPSSFAVKSTKIAQDGNWGRNGPIVEFWGDDHDKISGSGKLAGFYAIDATNPNGVGGVTRMARNFSLSWQNFRSLWMLYKNNGALHMSESLTQSTRDLLISTVGTIYIYYDNVLYFGCFDSFNCNESDENPYTLEYSFEFTVRAAFVLELPSSFDGTGQEIVKSQRLQASSGDQVVSDVVQQNGSQAAAPLLTSKGFL